MAENSYGGFWIRFLAYLVDSVIFFTLLVAVAAGAAFLGDLGSTLITAAALLGPVLYWGLMQASARQATFGKSLLGMKVTDTDGQRLSLGRSLGRELAKIVSSIPLMLGFLLAAFTGRKQALHDMIASTTVVREGSGHMLVALVVGLFGWIAPIGLVMALGVGLVAGMMGGLMGDMRDMTTEMKKDAQRRAAAPSAPVVQPAAPRPAAARPPVAAPPKDIDTLLATPLKGFEKPGTTRAGPAVLELSTQFANDFWIKAYAPPLDEFASALTISLSRVADASGGELYDPKNSLESGFFQRVSLKPESSPVPHLGGTRQVSLRTGAKTDGLTQVEGVVKVRLPLKAMVASFGASDVGKAQNLHGAQIVLKQLKGRDVEIEASDPGKLVATHAYGVDGTRMRAQSTSSGGGQLKLAFEAPVNRVEVVVAEGFAERSYPFTLTKTSVAGASLAAVPAAPPAASVAKPAPAAAAPAPVVPKVAAIEIKTAPSAVPAAAEKRADLPGPIQARAAALPGALEPLPARPGPKHNDLMSAVISGDAATVQELLALGKWADKPDSRGVTPLTAAAMRGDQANAELLLKAGADTGPALAVARARRDAGMTTLLERYAPTSKRP